MCPVYPAAMSTPDKEIAETIRHPWIRAAAVLLALAVLVTAALGGFRKAASAGTYPTVGAQTRVETGALAITALCSWTSDSAPGDQPSLPGDRYLMLRVRAENLADRNNALRLSKDVLLLLGDGIDVPAWLTRRSDDHSSSVQLQPRLPTEVDLIWDMHRLGKPAPLDPVWGIVRSEYRQGVYFDVQPGWVQAGAQAKIVLPQGHPCPVGKDA